MLPILSPEQLKESARRCRVEDLIHLEFVQEPKPEGEVANVGYLT